MARITGIGGVFFKADDPQALAASYRDTLGLPIEDGGAVMFAWSDGLQPGGTGHTVWGPFKTDTRYLDPPTIPFMVNFRVDDLDGMLERRRDAGAEIDDKIEDHPYGRFGWFMGPEGNRVKLCEPSTDAPYEAPEPEPAES
tara:strand:+ start:110 stop:532 length:423 start_codon:yes stop_codon:yes gene_type:complete